VKITDNDSFRLYDLVTEDMAIEDTIYVLGKALDKERICLDVFLKVLYHGLPCMSSKES
jgi:hypothetical protein